jgi:glycosyltransferase involved in cell wall biosynthesis
MKRGKNMHVAYLRRGPNFDRLSSAGVTLHELPCSGSYDPRIPYELLKLMRGIKPDLVQTWLPQMNILGGLAATLAGVPFIVSERSCAMSYCGGWKDWLRIRVAQRAAAIVTNSKGGKEYWIGRTAAPIEVIRNGIPFSEIDEVLPISDDEAQLQRRAELILCAGRFDEAKNWWPVLEALRRVLSVRASAAAVLFGEGSLKSKIVSKAGECSFGKRLRVMGFNARLWSWMKRSNAFVSVSLYEGNPNTVLEAVACGTPVILSDIPSHREILDDDSAYFVSLGAASKIAETILRALQNPAEAARKAERARSMVSPQILEASVERYLTLYSSTMERFA